MRAATYVRLSASRLGEEAPGLDRQREATEHFIRERGWELDDRHRFHDADVSAYSGAARPGFDELREAVDSGEVGAVVVWKLDRAFRSITDAAAFLGLVRDRGAVFISSSESVDTSTPFGPVLFSLFAAMAELESRTRSDRIAAWHLQRARDGKATGGGTRPFGFRSDGRTHEPSEVREIRRAARKLLSGKTTLTGIARDWNGRGVLTPTGGHWRKTTVRRLILSPRIAGLRQHGDETYPATDWKPIITKDDRLSLLTLFDGRPGPNAGRRYLLTGGLAVCGRCGANLIARPKGDGRRCYVCATDNGGCGRMRVLAAPLEEHVATQVDAVYAVTEPVDEPDRPDTADEARRQLAADEAALADLARDRYVHRSITGGEFAAAREPLVMRIAELQEHLAREPRPRRERILSGDLPTAPWETPPGTDPEGIDEWRAWVAEVVKRVVVRPGVPGRNFFTPDRVDIELAVLPGGGAQKG